MSATKAGISAPLLRPLNIHQTTSATRLILVAFGCIAVLASLMSASIGLSDYLEDALSKINCKCPRPLAIFLTYFPAASACVIAPQGFLSALSFAGISLVLWSILLPPIYSSKPGVPLYLRYIPFREIMFF